MKVFISQAPACNKKREIEILVVAPKSENKCEIYWMKMDVKKYFKLLIILYSSQEIRSRCILPFSGVGYFYWPVFLDMIKE